uniref:LYR motif containing 4 n=2 Tax=Elapidae TaxID=8602 RepID=A0A8C6XDW1_NAJNA
RLGLVGGGHFSLPDSENGNSFLRPSTSQSSAPSSSSSADSPSLSSGQTRRPGQEQQPIALRLGRLEKRQAERRAALPLRVPRSSRFANRVPDLSASPGRFRIRLRPRQQRRTGGACREARQRVYKMAASRRAEVLRLYRALLRESQAFNAYGYRTYAIRKIRDAFRENKNINESSEIDTLINKAKTNLEMIHRQVTIGQLYTAEKLVIECPQKA